MKGILNREKIQQQKRKFNIKSSETRRYIGASVASFTGMIIALSWNDLLQNFIDVLKESFPFLSLFGGLLVAIFLSFVAIFVGILFLNSLENSERKVESLIDSSLYWCIDFYNHDQTLKRKTRYFTLQDLEKRIITQMNFQNIEKNGNTIRLEAQDEIARYVLVLTPIEKEEYQKNTEKPLPLGESSENVDALPG